MMLLSKELAPFLAHHPLVFQTIFWNIRAVFPQTSYFRQGCHAAAKDERTIAILDADRRIILHSEALYGGYMNQNVFHSDPDIMGGKPVFPGTRVPASYLFDYLGSGESIEVFLDHYPTVSRQAAMAALKSAASLVEQDAHLAR